MAKLTMASGGTVLVKASAIAPGMSIGNIRIPPLMWWILGSAVVVVIGYLAALYVDDEWGPKTPIVLGPDVTVFALLFVAAQAIERLLEPFSKVLVPTEEKKQEVDSHKADAKLAANANNNAEAEAALQAAANKQGEVDLRRSGRAVLFWAIASATAFLLSAALGLFAIDILAADGTQPHTWLDILVTGMIIGGGTKPLHDLIANIEKTKEKAEDAAG